MGDDLNLDAIEARHIKLRDAGFDGDHAMVLALISALRRETERAEEANAALSLLYDDRDSWKARAIAAEAIAQCFDGVSAEDCRCAYVEIDVETQSDGLMDIQGRVRDALDRLDAVLRDRERSARERGGST